MWQDLAVALCLVMVVEGLMPFIAPRSWRQTMLQLATLADTKIRMMGLLSMLFGVGLLYWVR